MLVVTLFSLLALISNSNALLVVNNLPCVEEDISAPAGTDSHIPMAERELDYVSRDSLTQRSNLFRRSPHPQTSPVNSLFSAVSQRNVDLVTSIVNSNPSLVNSPSESGETPFLVACELGYTEIVALMLPKADLTRFGAQCLLKASKNLHLEVSRDLLIAERKPNVFDTEGNTPLILAAANPGAERMILLLIGYGASWDIQGEFGTTALLNAVKSSDFASIKILLLWDTNVNATNADGNSSLHFACSRSMKDVVDLLLSLKANVNAANKEGLTPLMIAALSNPDKSIAEALVKAGANVRAKSVEGKTALDYANERVDGPSDLREFLRTVT